MTADSRLHREAEQDGELGGEGPESRQETSGNLRGDESRRARQGGREEMKVPPPQQTGPPSACSETVQKAGAWGRPGDTCVLVSEQFYRTLVTGRVSNVLSLRPAHTARELRPAPWGPTCTGPTGPAAQGSRGGRRGGRSVAKDHRGKERPPRNDETAWAQS